MDFFFIKRTDEFVGSHSTACLKQWYASEKLFEHIPSKPL